MTTTWLLIPLLCLMLFGSLALQSYGIKWGLRWLKIANVSAGKGFLLLLLFLLANFVIGVGVGFILLATNSLSALAWVDKFAVPLQIVPPTIVIALLYKTQLWRAFLAALLPVGMAIGLSAFAIFVIRPYLYEAFYIPTGSMAPTLLGVHAQAACPQCSEPGYGTLNDIPPPGPNGFIPSYTMPMICENGHTFTVEGPLPRAGNGDRILVNKLLQPRRWDIVAFRLPSDPSVAYVKRLVGLPGEELFIRDGAVWINGERLNPPDEVKNITYLTTIDDPRNPMPSSADPSDPAKLGPDEYFFLGDFSAAAYDARLWERGAPGHPRYAVPEENIIGVVTHIYWPIKRWRTFR
jgi:signal peptidase I